MPTLREAEEFISHTLTPLARKMTALEVGYDKDEGKFFIKEWAVVAIATTVTSFGKRFSFDHEFVLKCDFDGSDGIYMANELWKFPNVEVIILDEELDAVNRNEKVQACQARLLTKLGVTK